ncbi:MAG: hypothetical protein RLZZ444_3502 [Pseudomonadota bacterium]|jgi:hypothetical protein
MRDTDISSQGDPPFRGLETRPLAILTARLDSPQSLGNTPEGSRKIVNVLGGSFIGPRINAIVLPGGGDWALTRADGVLVLDVRLTIRTDDGALIYCRYSGMRHGPPEVMARLSKGEMVDPAEMYFRIAPNFETADPRYSFLNRLIAIGVGERLHDGPRYHIHEVL